MLRELLLIWQDVIGIIQMEVPMMFWGDGLADKKKENRLIFWSLLLFTAPIWVSAILVIIGFIPS